MEHRCGKPSTSRTGHPLCPRGFSGPIQSTGTVHPETPQGPSAIWLRLEPSSSAISPQKLPHAPPPGLCLTPQGSCRERPPAPTWDAGGEAVRRPRARGWKGPGGAEQGQWELVVPSRPQGAPHIVQASLPTMEGSKGIEGPLGLGMEPVSRVTPRKPGHRRPRARRLSAGLQPGPGAHPVGLLPKHTPSAAPS